MTALVKPASTSMTWAPVMARVVVAREAEISRARIDLIGSEGILI